MRIPFINKQLLLLQNEEQIATDPEIIVHTAKVAASFETLTDGTSAHDE